MKHFVAPSLLSADFGNLKSEMDMINRSECDWLHIDIMDGVFVPNISFGFPVLKSVARLCEKPLDVHLMIVQPEKFLNEVKALGAYSMNVHVEACPHLHRVVQQIKETGMKAGVTLNPARSGRIQCPSCFVFDGYHRGCGHRHVDGCQSGIRRPDIYSPYIR